MQPSVLIIGGMGRIGRAVAQDLLIHTQADLTLTSRTVPRSLKLDCREHFLALDLANLGAVSRAIQDHQLVIHCAGPFRDRDHHVLKTCIQHRVPYLDVADSSDYVREAIALHESAVAQNVIAVVSTGVFPGISCSMVRQAIEQLDQAHEIHLSYVVAGSGGAGVTVLRTTFIELQTLFQSKQQGQLKSIQPYSDREVLEFPHYGKNGVYWFNTIEAMTLAQSFPSVDTITTKFGSVPDFYNYLTWLVARAPKAWLSNSRLIEFLSQVSYKMTQVSDRFSGIGIEMRVSVAGIKNQLKTQKIAVFYNSDTASSAGQGAGMIAQLILEKQLSTAGIWPVEKILPTSWFETAAKCRGLEIEILK